MIQTEIQNQQVKVETGIQCDDCGRIDSVNDFEMGEYLRIDFVGGYGSVFGDGYRIKADLCQYCVQKRLGDVLRGQYQAPKSGAA